MMAYLRRLGHRPVYAEPPNDLISRPIKAYFGSCPTQAQPNIENQHQRATRLLFEDLNRGYSLASNCQHNKPLRNNTFKHIEYTYRTFENSVQPAEGEVLYYQNKARRTAELLVYKNGGAVNQTTRVADKYSPQNYKWNQLQRVKFDLRDFLKLSTTSKR